MLPSYTNELSHLVLISDGCLLWREEAFDLLYQHLMAVVAGAQDVQWKNVCAEILSTLNGEN